jgi:hypothetical protein
VIAIKLSAQAGAPKLVERAPALLFVRFGPIALALPPGLLPYPQPDKGYDGQQNEQVYESIRADHVGPPLTPSDNLPEIALVPPPPY